MEKPEIDLRRLRYFIAVCEHGGFSRASTKVGIAQPSLTRQIKLLERELGVPLVKRTGRGAGPTLEGRLLLDRSKPYLEKIDETVRLLRRQSARLSEKVVLGVCPTIAPLFVENLLSQLAETHSSVRLTVIEAYSGDLDNLMEHGTIDLSLTYSPQMRDDVTCIDLFSERLVLVTPPSLIEIGKPRSIAEISGLQLILPSPIHELRNIIDCAAERHKIVLAPQLELDSLSAIKSMLLADQAIHATILPITSVSEELATGRLIAHSIAAPEMKRTLALVLPRQGRRAIVADVLTSLVRERAAALATMAQAANPPPAS